MPMSNEDTTAVLKGDSQNSIQADLPPDTPLESQEPDIDLALLAQKLYSLCKQELNVEHERLIRSRFW